MRAVLLREFGGPEVLQLVEDHPRPARRPGEVLVEVHCSSVNPIDCKARAGELTRLLCPLPRVLGRDFAGVVAEADAGSTLPPGTRVWGFTDWSMRRVRSARSGAYAECVCAPEAQVAPLPSSLGFGQAAALAPVSLTAWQALDAAGLQRGQRVLIHAGAGGVGSVAIQLAKARGLHVTTTCSTRNLDFVRECGADEAVDYTGQRFDEVYRDRPFNAVIDVVGGDYEPRSLAVLSRQGTYVSIANSGWMQRYGSVLGWAVAMGYQARGRLLHALGLGPAFRLVMVRPDSWQLATVGRLVEEGQVRAVIDRVLPLERVREAHEYVERGHTRGKVVLRVREA